MKSSRVVYIIILIVISLSNHGCRKGVDEYYQVNPETLEFSLVVGRGSGAKTEITNPGGGTLNVVWSEGDVIYVAGNISGYLGSLTLKSGAGNSVGEFQGTINTFDTQTLNFYYLGKRSYSIATGAISVSVDMSTQLGTLDDIENYHVASASVSNVTGGTTYLTAALSNQTAIGYFDLSSFGDAIGLYGINIYKGMNINLLNGSISGSNQALYNTVNIDNNDSGMYLAFVPSNDVEIEFSDGIGSWISESISLAPGEFYSDAGNPIKVTKSNIEGSVGGLFSVSENKQVIFSQGNLQYQASTGIFSFAQNQYSYIGDVQGNTTPQANRETQSAWIDLFGWGTSGYNNTENDSLAVNFQPWTAVNNINTSNTTNQYGYGPSTNMISPNLTGASANYDWGIYNPITNGGNTAGLWRTLTYDEWDYLINTRDNNNLYAGVGKYLSGAGTLLVEGLSIIGLFLLPDDYPTTYTSDTSWEMTYNELVAANGVFLPSGGYRTTIVNTPNVIYDGYIGSYWSSTYYNALSAHCISFADTGLSTNDNGNRYGGFSVRLVMDL